MSKREARDRADLAALTARIARSRGVTMKEAQRLQHLRDRVGLWNFIRNGRS